MPRTLRRIAAVAMVASFVLSPAAQADRGDIWTIGGGGLLESEDSVVVATGDGGPAAQATFLGAYGIAVDSDGTTYVTETAPARVRAIFPDGHMDTVAGTSPGFSGDGGSALAAQMYGPSDVEADPAGGVVIADSGNNRLRKLWPDGSITTISGGYQQSIGSIGDGGALVAAKLVQPSGVAFAPDGEMYIREGTRVRRVDLTGTITTLAAGFIGTGGVDVDSQNNVYVPDGDVVWRVDPSGTKTIFAGRHGLAGSKADGIAATDAELTSGYQVAVAANDDVYITDYSPGRIRRISAGVITTVAGGGTMADATGCRPAVNAENVLAVSLDFNPDGDIVFVTNNLVRVIALTDRDCPSITPLTPTRVLETRSTDGQIGYSGGRPTPGQTVVLDLGRAGSPVPPDATAAALNLTVTNAINDGYVTAWPCEADQPITSNINVRAGQTAANSVLVTLGSSNTVCLFDQAGGDLVVDVTGFIGSAVPYHGLVPYRALETRTTEAQWQYRGAKPIAGQIVHVPITGWGIGDNSVSVYASAVVLNVTATDATADGYVTVWSCVGPPPTASNLNVTRSGTVAHLVVAQLGLDPTNQFGISKEVCLFTQSGTHLVVDILGAFMPESPYVPVAPDRLLETRVADGQIGFVGARPVAGQVVEIDVLGRAGGTVPPTARAVVLNVTATNPGTPGYVTVWPCGVDRPQASSLNLAAGDTQSNAVVVGLGSSGKVCVFTQGGADLIADLNGYFA